MLITKNSLIFRDVLYAVLIAIVLWPGNTANHMQLWMKIAIVIIAVAQRVWQHVSYYKVTGKIY